MIKNVAKVLTLTQHDDRVLSPRRSWLTEVSLFGNGEISPDTTISDPILAGQLALSLRLIILCIRDNYEELESGAELVVTGRGVCTVNTRKNEHYAGSL